MNENSLVFMYEKGVITADHLVAECLILIDPENPTLILDALPSEIRAKMVEYAGRYRLGEMLSNYGVLPSPEQVEAATQWIDQADRIQTAAASGA